MAIRFTKYVDIVSGVGAGAVVRQRELIARIWTDNQILPPGTFLEFSAIEDVGAYFGTGSVEYARAEFYFGWVSKNITQPQKISFARWVDTAVAPQVYGKPGIQTLATYTGISDGSFHLTMGGFTFQLSALDFTGAASLAAVAAIIQTAIRAESGGGALWTGATVTYDSQRQCFDIVGGAVGAAVISITGGSVGTDVSSVLGWTTGAIFANGSAVETITNTLANSAALSDNFGTIIFVPTLDQAQYVEAATWNQTQNVKYQLMVIVTAGTAAALSAALMPYAGNGLTLQGPSGEFHELCPTMILAATNYNARNSVQNYEFQQFALTPTVTDDADSDNYDNLRVNYYGQTQTAGQLIAFYQQGVLTGQATDPLDMNTYANEQWLKSAAGAAIMTLLLALAKVSANQGGRSQVLGVLLPVVNQGLTNGTISVGKTLTPTQQAYITQQTGDPKAWYQVQTIGYWLDCSIVPSIAENGSTIYTAVYALIYSKDDVIRMVQGSHQLI